MTELELLIEFHKEADRQGPGSPSDTLKALSFMKFEGKQDLKLADIGCGSGGQTITLAQHLNADIIAVDLFPEFLTRLNRQVRKLRLTNKITTLVKSMEDLPFEKEEFDIIWSEGAIYIMGFEKGIQQWKEYLKSGGYLAVSEITWTTDSRPKEIEEHWNREYPEIDTASNKIRFLEKSGFSPVGYFILPYESWLNYYRPMEERFESFLKKHHHSEAAKKIIEAEKDEILKYQTYKDYLSYGFYIAKKQ